MHLDNIVQPFVIQNSTTTSLVVWSSPFNPAFRNKFIPSLYPSVGRRCPILSSHPSPPHRTITHTVTSLDELLIRLSATYAHFSLIFVPIILFLFSERNLSTADCWCVYPIKLLEFLSEYVLNGLVVCVCDVWTARNKLV